MIFLRFGYTIDMSKILGIDEVGRGAWAGPLVVGAVVLGDDFAVRHPEPTSSSSNPRTSTQVRGNGLFRGSHSSYLRLDDSKKLTAKKRQELAVEIKKYASGIGIGWVSSATVDKIGLSAALKLGAKRAVAQIDCEYDQIIIDGTMRLIDDPRVTVMPRADGLIAAVSAASIVAKVARDDYMAQLDKVFDGYDFACHVGYGTAAHQAAIAKHGVLPIHRVCFTPVANVIATQLQFAELELGKQSRGGGHPELVSGSNPSNPLPSTMTSETASPPGLAWVSRQARLGPADVSEVTVDSASVQPVSPSFTSTEIGGLAEDVAADYLMGKGHEIIGRNWKTKFCEVDIISIKDEVVYFTEVKYREVDRWGGGVDAITESKEKQMRFAARFWMETEAPDDKPDAKISVIAVSGIPPKVDDYIPDIDK